MNKKLIIGFILLLIGFIPGTIIGNRLQADPVTKFEPVRQKGFQYISPLLYCETAPAENNDLTKNLSQELEGYISESRNLGIIQDASVYFRIPDLGDWISINEKIKYTPASLLKIPTMIAYLKKADQNPSTLSNTIKFESGNGNEMENIKPNKEMKSGEIYTIDELITRMATYSDNNAKDLLIKNINEEDFANVFEEVGIGKLDYLQTENFMDARRYASFFRILYNASYLSRTMSEKALKLLTQSEFNMGLEAGVPPNTKVAHKFGERSYGISKEKQLHDCGIIYSPNNPYILCVMTRGYSFENLKRVIATISEKTYNEVMRWKKN